MNDLPIPPKSRKNAGGNKWGAALDAVVKGKVVFFPDMNSPDVSGNINRTWIAAQGFRVRTRTRDHGVVVWIERRSAK